MIAKMKTVCVIASASHKADMLDRLRDLGILHIVEKKSADSALLDRYAQFSSLSSELKEYADKKQPQADILSDEEFETVNEKVAAASSRKTELEAERNSINVEIDRLRPWGDFDPTELRTLKAEGIELSFYRLGKQEYEQLCAAEDIRFIHLASVDKMDTVAVVGKLDGTIQAIEFAVPEKSLSALEKEAEDISAGIEDCKTVLKENSVYLNSYSAQMLKTQNDAEYSSVSHTAEGEDGLVWLSGYIPEEDIEKFTAAACENGWAWGMDDVTDDDETVPTKVKYTKVTALIKPVFDILGTVPGYREYDISFWFLAFFTLFFAMIIGDAGYGMLFLIGAIVLTVRAKKVTNITLLLYILAGATVIWGAMTGTWFGFEEAMHVPFLKALVVPGFANYPQYFGVETTAAQNNVMKFCFTIGVVQLALACIMNVRRKIGAKDLSWLADLGWLLAVCALYFLVLFLVIGQEINVIMVAAVVIAGFLLVVVFGGMSPDKTFAQGLKSGVADAFTVFLNTISAFGNVMSYIRLFAVGMASLAIAQSFNSMGMNFKGVLVVAGIIIILFGHVLNIVMGFLSVAVHGVRLNLLEFSGQLGMEWSGTEYDPFRKLDKIKK